MCELYKLLVVLLCVDVQQQQTLMSRHSLRPSPSKCKSLQLLEGF